MNDEIDSRIARAYLFFNGKWPKELTSGIMFFDGLRITLHDFVGYHFLVKEVIGNEQ